MVDLIIVCVFVCVRSVCCSLQQQQQSANLPINALGPSLGPQLVSSQTPLQSTPPAAASSAPTVGGATNLPHPQPSSRSSTPTLPAPAPGATPPRPTQPQPQVELPTAAQMQPPPQPPTTPVRLRSFRMSSTLTAQPLQTPIPLPVASQPVPSTSTFLHDNFIFTHFSIQRSGIVASLKLGSD